MKAKQIKLGGVGYTKPNKSSIKAKTRALSKIQKESRKRNRK